jgi:ABC transporter ATM
MAETVSDIQKESGVERYQIIQSLNGLKTIKQLQKEDYFVKQYENILSNKTKLSKKYSWYYTIYFCTFTFINNILPFIVVLLGVYFVMNDEVSIGAIIIMQSLVNSLPEPILSIADFYNGFNISKALVKKNKELIDSNSIGENESQLITPKFEKLNLLSKGMKFKDKEVLVGTTIEINKGEIVVIRGHSGVGKTTLLNLISRFLDYNKEFISIKYNNHELLDFSYPSYYEKVLLVEQNVITVNDTLFENICLGEVYSNEFLNEIIEVSQLNDFISEKGFDFVINEEAGNISGGERQRIGLARMLIRKPEILLLDEPTSALDNETSMSLVNKLKLFALKYNITIVVVSHKDDFEKIANTVIKL